VAFARAFANFLHGGRHALHPAIKWVYLDVPESLLLASAFAARSPRIPITEHAIDGGVPLLARVAIALLDLLEGLRADCAAVERI